MFAEYIVRSLLNSPRFRAVTNSIRPGRTRSSRVKRAANTASGQRSDKQGNSLITIAKDAVMDPSLLRKKDTRPHFDILDTTLGLGVYAKACLEALHRQRYPEAFRELIRVVGLDVDPTLQSAPEVCALGEAHSGRTFRFIPGKMSSALTLFGEDSFDGILVDLGANPRQLTDPARGFDVYTPFVTTCAMTYAPPVSPTMRSTNTSAVHFLNTAHYDALMAMFVDVAVLPYRDANFLSNRILRRQGSLCTNQDIAKLFSPLSRANRLSGVTSVGSAGWDVDIPTGNTGTGAVGMKALWTEFTNQQPDTALSRVLHALRSVTNYEEQEFAAFLRILSDLLRPGARCVIVCSSPWMEVECASLEREHPLLFAPVFPVSLYPRSSSGAPERTANPKTMWVLEKSTDNGVPVFDRKLDVVWPRTKNKKKLKAPVTGEAELALQETSSPDVDDLRYALSLDDYSYESYLMKIGAGVYHDRRSLK